MPMPRKSVLVAAAIEVLCPSCGEPQPNPDDGSHLWSTDQLAAKAGTRRECTACDKVMMMDAPAKVQVMY